MEEDKVRIILWIIIVFLGMTIKEFKIIPRYSVDFLAGWVGKRNEVNNA